MNGNTAPRPASSPLDCVFPKVCCRPQMEVVNTVIGGQSPAWGEWGPFQVKVGERGSADHKAATSSFIYFCNFSIARLQWSSTT
jgi:hypothetical protein